MNKVLACIDASVYAQSVCDHAVWAAGRLDAPLEFLHVLNRHPVAAAARDLSGSIGLGSQDALLAELVQLDEKQNKLAQQHGRELLDRVVSHVKEQGVPRVAPRLRNGALVDALTDLEKDVRLFVLGKRGEHADFATLHLGSELERAVRAVQRPLLVTSRQFKPIHRFLIAFDGSQTMRKGVEMVATEPLLEGLPCHLVMAGNDIAETRAQVQWAHELLASAGFDVHSSIQPGNAESVIGQYVSANGIDLLVMGAYGHSRIRQLIVGSTTTTVLRTCLIPVLLVR